MPNSLAVLNLDCFSQELHVLGEKGSARKRQTMKTRLWACGQFFHMRDKAQWQQLIMYKEWARESPHRRLGENHLSKGDSGLGQLIQGVPGRKDNVYGLDDPNEA